MGPNKLFEKLAIIMIFIGSGLLVFGFTYLLGWLLIPCNPFIIAWIVESTILAFLLFMEISNSVL